MTDQPPESPADVMIPTSRAAALLVVSRWTVWRVPHAELPYVTTPGNHRRYRKGDVLAYRSRHSEAPRSSVAEDPGRSV